MSARNRCHRLERWHRLLAIPRFVRNDMFCLKMLIFRKPLKMTAMFTAVTERKRQILGDTIIASEAKQSLSFK